MLLALCYTSREWKIVGNALPGNKKKTKIITKQCLALLESQQHCTKIHGRLLFENGEIHLVPSHIGKVSVYKDNNPQLYAKQNKNKVPL